MALLILFFIKELLEGRDLRTVFLRGLVSVAVLVGGLGLYSLAFALVQHLTGIPATNSYNGVARVGDYTGVPILSLLKNTWLYPFQSLLHPNTFHRRLVVPATLLLLLLTLAGLVYLARKRALGRGECLLTALLLLALPFGMNVVYFISKGLEHTLMTFSFLTPYLLTAYLLERWTPPKGARATALVRPAGGLLLAVVVACGCLYSNQVYLKKDLEERATLSLITRVLDRMEQTEGYLPGTTVTAFIGNLSNGPTGATRPGYDYTAVGLDGKYATSYIGTLDWYFRDVMGYAIAMAPQDVLWAYFRREDVRTMPAFPAAGSVAMLDGVLVVKLS